MPRRSYQTTQRGKPFASEWPEWHVECARTGCDAHQVVAGIGECMTAREAEREAGKVLPTLGWVRSKGLWYCQKCAVEQSANSLK